MPFQFRLWDSTPGSFDSLTKTQHYKQLSCAEAVIAYLNLHGNTDPNHRLLSFCSRTEGVWGGWGTRRGGELEARESLEGPQGADEQRAARGRAAGALAAAAGEVEAAVGGRDTAHKVHLVAGLEASREALAPPVPHEDRAADPPGHDQPVVRGCGGGAASDAARGCKGVRGGVRTTIGARRGRVQAVHVVIVEKPCLRTKTRTRFMATLERAS
jgi:hypothetical protein